MDDKFLLDDAQWKMAYFSCSEKDDGEIDVAQLQARNSPTEDVESNLSPNPEFVEKDRNPEGIEKGKETKAKEEVVEEYPEVPLQWTSQRPPTYHEIAASASKEMYDQRTLEAKTYGIHYSDIVEAYASARKDFSFSLKPVYNFIIAFCGF